MKRKTPIKRGKRKTPIKRGKRKTPSKRGKRKTPIKRGKRKTPSKRGKRKTPIKRGKRKTPVVRDITQDRGCSHQRRWRRLKRIGKGSVGSAFEVCDRNNKDCSFILKIQPLDYEYFNELKALVDLQHAGAPKLYDYWHCRNKGYLVMEKLDPKCRKVKKASMHKKIRRFLDKLRKKNYLHIDVHRGNIACRGTDAVLIDYGRAVKKRRGKYGNHPASSPLQQLTFKQLENLQDYNYQHMIGSHRGKHRRKLTAEYLPWWVTE
jgi:serine/threonine protein kinase